MYAVHLPIFFRASTQSICWDVLYVAIGVSGFLCRAWRSRQTEVTNDIGLVVARFV